MNLNTLRTNKQFFLKIIIFCGLFLLFYSCKTDKKKTVMLSNRNTINCLSNEENLDTIYNIIDTIWNSKYRFSDENIRIMGQLYRSKTLQKIVRENAYGGVSVYFATLFYEDCTKFYRYLSTVNDSIITQNIVNDISQNIQITEGEGSDSAFVDSVYINHLKLNPDNIKYINSIFPR